MHYKQIQTYDLYSFAKELQEAVKDGYSVQEENVYFPQQIGAMFIATVGKDEVIKETVKEEPVKPKRSKGSKDAAE